MFCSRDGITKLWRSKGKKEAFLYDPGTHSLSGKMIKPALSNVSGKDGVLTYLTHVGTVEVSKGRSVTTSSPYPVHGPGGPYPAEQHCQALSPIQDLSLAVNWSEKAKHSAKNVIKWKWAKTKAAKSIWELSSRLLWKKCSQNQVKQSPTELLIDFLISLKKREREKRTDCRQKWLCSFLVHVEKKSENLWRAAQQTETRSFEQLCGS